MVNKHFKKTTAKKEYKCIKCKKTFNGIYYSYQTLGFVTGSNPIKICEECYLKSNETDLIEFILKLPFKHKFTKD
jgi:hypothetical protein